ncbi:bifunctional Protein kinase-like domain superfamily/Serine-threonine-protein kinase [Babesia duncani]|nr:bifunctional Protein kinase-like domain superfamily/Serine-threonine-protein kinase [Babesia duncani]
MTIVCSQDLEKFEEILAIWEAIRMLAKNSGNMDNCFKMLTRTFVHLSQISTESKATSTKISQEFDVRLKRGLQKGRVLFHELLQLSHLLTRYYAKTGNVHKQIQQGESRPRTRLIAANSLDNLQFPSNQAHIPLLMLGNFIILDRINEGSLGKVHVAINKIDNKIYAVKIISLAQLKGDAILYNRFKDEITIATSLHHPNIVRTFEVLVTPTSILIVMEYCDGGDLIGFVRNYGQFEEEVARVIFEMVLNGVAYMHSDGICHRDLKPENILLKHVLDSNVNIDDNGEAFIVKIGDFGAATNDRYGLFDTVGTMSYAAPEVLSCGGVNEYSGKSADIWSLGVVLYAMLFGQLPWNNEDESIQRAYNEIITKKLHFPKTVSKSVRDLLEKMLEVDPCERISINGIFDHAWLKGSNGEKYIYIDNSFILHN